jgi:hypothetical protein
MPGIPSERDSLDTLPFREWDNMPRRQDATRLREVNSHAHITGSVPDIVVHSAGSQELFENHSMTSVPLISEQTPDDSWRVLEAGCDSQSALVSEGSSRALHSQFSNGGLIPYKERDSAPTVTYSLSVVLLPDTESRECGPHSIDFSKDNIYEMIRNAAYHLVTTAFAHLPQSKQLKFLRGECTIAADNVFPFNYPLDYADNWEDVHGAVTKLWDSGRRNSFNLEVSCHYACLENTAKEEQSLAEVVRCEIDYMMRDSLIGHYISCTDLMRVICPDTVHCLVVMNSELRTLNSEQTQVLVDKILTTAPKLLAMCIEARLQLKCFTQLLDSGLSDEQLPLNERQLCHPRCGVSFRLLLRSQGRFMAPKFKLGENKILHPCVALPIRYWPRDPGIQASYQDDSESTDDIIDLPTTGENVIRHKAACGQGAFSYVYRVRLHRDHHELDAVGSQLFL